jgi:hypothetical protein
MHKTWKDLEYSNMGVTCLSDLLVVEIASSDG